MLVNVDQLELLHTADEKKTCLIKLTMSHKAKVHLSYDVGISII